LQNIAKNPEQLQAVIQILSGSSRPYPYLLYGPPGTGKTVTLAEAIKQIWKKDSSFRIIVATPSNSAADVIALRLMEDIPKGLEKSIVREPNTTTSLNCPAFKIKLKSLLHLVDFF